MNSCNIFHNELKAKIQKEEDIIEKLNKDILEQVRQKKKEKANRLILQKKLHEKRQEEFTNKAQTIQKVIF